MDFTHEPRTPSYKGSGDDAEYHALGIYWILRWILAAITVLGNVLIVVSIASRPSLRNLKNWFVVSLAMADFLIGAFNCPTEFFSSHYNSDFSNAQNYFLDVTSTCLVAMAIDRYMAVIHPFKYQSFMTKTRQRGLIVSSWLIPLFVRLPLFIGLGSESAITYYDCFTVLLLRAIPLIILPVTFARVFLVARRINRRIVSLRMQVAFNHGSEAPENHTGNDARGTQSSANATAALIGFFSVSYALDVWDVISRLYSDHSPRCCVAHRRFVGELQLCR